MRILWVGALLCLVGCARSAEEVQREFDEYLSEANMCTQASECVFISPGCPLGCSAAVRADRADEAREKADDLISQYEVGGRRCEYDCVGHTGVDCVEQRCVVLFE